MLTLIEAIPFITTLRSAAVPYALLNAAHILALGLLLGAVVPLDLGLLKIPGFRWILLPEVRRGLRSTALAAFAGAALTGFLLFAVRPAEYLDNTAFLVKLSLLAAAGLNAALFWGIRVEPLRRAFAAASLGLWLSVLVAGRLIGFG